MKRHRGKGHSESNELRQIMGTESGPTATFDARRRSHRPRVRADFGSSQVVLTIPVLREKRIEFEQLKDGSLLELIEHPKSRGESILARWDGKQVTFHSEYIFDGCKYLPIPGNDSLLRHLVLPNGAVACESVITIAFEVMMLIKRCVSLDERSLSLVGLFVLSTWLTDRLPVAPYLSVIGLPQSGKSTLLKVLRLLCRRALLTGEISSAAFYNLCDQLKPTLLIDEAGTPGDDRALRHLLRMGNAPDAVVVRKDKAYKVFGPKVISWIQAPEDAALTSRCIPIQMFQSSDPKLARVNDRDVEEEAARLRNRLLMFRFERYDKIQTVRTPGDERLTPRMRDLFESLAVVCEDNEHRGMLLDLFKLDNVFVKEPLPPEQDAVLSALFVKIHEREFQNLVLINDVTETVNDLLKRAGMRLRISPRKVGAVITSFGIQHKRRMTKGWTILLDRTNQETIHTLVERHGLDSMKNEYLNVSTQECQLCNPR